MIVWPTLYLPTNYITYSGGSRETLNFDMGPCVMQFIDFGAV